MSYIPNNAWLVRVGAGGAALLAGDPVVQAVVPFEPYFKLKGGLLAEAVEGRPLPKGNRQVGLLNCTSPLLLRKSLQYSYKSSTFFRRWCLPNRR